MKTINTPSELYQLLQDVTNHIVTWAKPGMRMCELDAEARSGSRNPRIATSVWQKSGDFGIWYGDHDRAGGLWAAK